MRSRESVEEKSREAFRLLVFSLRFKVNATRVNKKRGKDSCLLVPQRPNTLFPSLPVYNTFLPSKVFIENVPALLQLNNPQFRSVLALQFFGSALQGVNMEAAENQRSATSLSLLSVYRWTSIHLFCSAANHFCLYVNPPVECAMVTGLFCRL